MLEVRNLSHSFPGTGNLFEGLSFQAKAGEMIAIVGPSGSGKSTLLHLIAGWEKPKKGSIVTRGVKKTGWVFQNPVGLPKRSALDHVVVPLLAKGSNRPQAEVEAKKLLDLFHLQQVAQRDFAQLSGGEAQRLMLARALALKPDLLLVDEPTAQLDPKTAREVNEVLGNVAHEDTLVVVATHDEATRNACHRVIDLRNLTPELGLAHEN